MAVKLPYPVKRAPKDPLRPFIIAPDQEILPIFNHMGKIMVRCIIHIAKIDRGRPRSASSINHLAESAAFILLPPGLDDKVHEPSVQDGIERIHVDLVKALCGFPARAKECIWVIGVPVNIGHRTVAGNKLVFPVIKLLFKFPVKSNKKVP